MINIILFAAGLLCGILLCKIVEKKNRPKPSSNERRDSKSDTTQDRISNLEEIYLNNYPKANQHGVLFVEDDAMLVEMYAMKFKKTGYNIAALPNADGEFIEKVVTMKPDLISLGIILGGKKTGFDALKLLKADNRTKNIPVIILSNLGYGGNVQKGISLGAVDYYIKANHTPQEIVDRYSTVLKKAGVIR